MIFTFVVPLQAAPRCQELFVISERVDWHQRIPVVVDFKQAFSSKKILVDQELKQAAISHLMNQGLKDPRIWPQFKYRALKLLHSPLLDWSISSAALYLTITQGALPILPQLKNLKLERQELEQLIDEGLHSDYAQSLAKKYEQTLNRRVSYTKIKAYLNVLSFVVIAAIISQMIYEKEQADAAAEAEGQKFIEGIRKDNEEIKNRPIKTQTDILFEIVVVKLEIQDLKRKLTEEEFAQTCAKIPSQLYCPL